MNTSPLAIGVLILALAWSGAVACIRRGEHTTTSVWVYSSSPEQSQTRARNADLELTERLRALCNGVDGEKGVAVIHVESGQSAEMAGDEKLPLFSVFKLPLAVAVLKRVEQGRLTLDRKVNVTPADVAPGSQFNADLWQRPAEKTVGELLEYSIVRSDNTSSDKLLQLIDGPAAVTERMRALGFSNIDIVSTVREFSAHRDKPNTATATDLARLLAQLQRGEVLQPAHLSLLRGFMERARTGGERRLRANLPSGTEVAEKTGTGDNATNDVGLITLPQGKGHLAIAVLISGSKSSAERQERLIAELAQAAYDSYAGSTPEIH